MRRSAFVLTAAALALASCGGSSESSEAEPASSDAAAEQPTAGLATVSPDAAAAVIEADPDGLVVLDIRTPEEFAEGRLDDAVLVDFYDPDFADQLAELDPDAPYVLYCRSGNRSGEALEIMDDLGFNSVSNVDGGILAWAEAGLPVVVE
jgi:rhodanese-related sulfurtransferase